MEAAKPGPNPCTAAQDCLKNPQPRNPKTLSKPLNPETLDSLQTLNSETLDPKKLSKPLYPEALNPKTVSLSLSLKPSAGNPETQNFP